MDIINGTPRPFQAKYDGELYAFPPFEIVSVSDECGTHMVNKHRRVGLRQVRFGDDPAEVKLACIKELVTFYRRAIMQHERVNAEQVEKKFSPLPKPPVVKEAEQYLPDLERALKKLEKGSEEKESAERKKRIEDALGVDFEMPKLEQMDMDAIRAFARDRGVDYDRRWGKAKLISAINEQLAEGASEQREAS